jgi:hypothetical protein
MNVPQVNLPHGWYQELLRIQTSNETVYLTFLVPVGAAACKTKKEVSKQEGHALDERMTFDH